jgi:hypothetical protein
MNNNILEILETNEVIDDFNILKVLNDKDLRTIFINQYEYFHKCNQNNLALFLKSNYKIETDNFYKIDLLDLSININFFEHKIYDLIKIDLKKRKSYILKLTMLDYLNTFYKIPVVKREYFLLNNDIYKNTNNKLLSFQSLLNLSIEDDSLKNEILKKLKKENSESFYYYRIINNFVNFEHFNNSKIFKAAVLNIIKTTKNLNLKQKKELQKMLVI